MLRVDGGELWGLPGGPFLENVPSMDIVVGKPPEQSTMWDRNKRWFMFSHLSTGKPNKDHLAIKICLVVVGAVKTIKAMNR